MREQLPQKYKHLVDEPETGLIITEGTDIGLFQSNLENAVNVYPVFPLRDESEVKTTKIKNNTRTGPVIVVALQTIDPTSQLRHGHDKNFTYVWDFLNQFKDLEDTLGPDFDLFIVSETKKAKSKISSADIDRATRNAQRQEEDTMMP